VSDVTRRSFLRTTAAAGLATLPMACGPGRPGAEAEGSTAGAEAPAARPVLAAPTAQDPLGVRGEFPATEGQAYLNTASSGPLSRTAYRALMQYEEVGRLRRRGGAYGAAESSARGKFARLFGADEDEIGFLYSTSDGENVVTSGMEWRAGDNVVIDELHFTTTFVLYRELERRHGIELRIVPASDGRPTVDDYAARTDDRTRLISVAWVSNRNGYRHDLTGLADLAHAHGAYLYADGIQAFGAFATNLHDEGVDFACGNGYKWMFAEFGCAPFYVRREHLAWLRPDRYGHSQVAETLPDHRFRLLETAEKYEYANVAYGPVTALDAALDVLAAVGLERIEAHTVALAGELRAGIADLGLELFTPPDNPSSIVSVYHGIEPDRLASALREADVQVTFQEEGRLLRAGVAMFNNRDDVDRLLAVFSGLV